MTSEDEKPKEYVNNVVSIFTRRSYTASIEELIETYNKLPYGRLKDRLFTHIRKLKEKEKLTNEI